MKAITFDTPAVTKGFSKLPDHAQRALLAKLEAYASRGEGRLKRLRGRPGLRLRAGDYRLIIEETQTEIIIVACGDRRDIYD